MNFTALGKFNSIALTDGISCKEMVDEFWRWVYIDQTMKRDEAFHKTLGLLLGLKIAGLLTEQEYDKLKKYYTAWFSF